jgi:hypothetical protein
MYGNGRSVHTNKQTIAWALSLALRAPPIMARQQGKKKTQQDRIKTLRLRV